MRSQMTDLSRSTRAAEGDSPPTEARRRLVRSQSSGVESINMRHMVGISGRQDGDQFLLDELEDGFGFEPPQKKGLCLSAQSGQDEQLPCNERGVHDNEQAVVRTDAFEDILSGLARLQEGILTVHNALGLSRASRI